MPKKHLYLLAGVLLFITAASVSQAADVKSAEVKVSLSTIHKAINIVDKDNEADGTRQQLSVVAEGIRATSDVEAHDKIYLTYLRSGEKTALSASFLISEKSRKLLSAERVEAGKYQVVAIEKNAESGEREKVQYDINAAQLFIDEEKATEWATDDVFISGPINSTIKVTRTVIE